MSQLQNIVTALEWHELPCTISEGHYLQPEELQRLDNMLGSSADTQAQLTEANRLVTEGSQLVTSLQNQLTAAQNANTALTTERDNLQAEVTRLGGQSSGQGSAPIVAADGKTGGATEKVPSYLSDKNPANEWLDKQLPKKKS